MPRVRVSTARFASMLENRHLDVAHFREGLDREIDVESLLVADAELDFEDLIALAKRLKHPWPYLLVDHPERPAKQQRDNRTTRNQRKPLSPELVDQIAAAEAMLDAAADLFPEVAVEMPPVQLTTALSPNKAGEAIRSFLGVSDQLQVDTKGDYGSLTLWSRAIQARGVYVSMRRLEDPTVRAFSLVAGEQAVVVADTQDIPYARIFSLLHEYAHVLLRTAGICDLDDHTTLERYCNQVAAAVLMPGALLRKVTQGHRWGESVVDDERVVARVSGRLGVSKASLLIRLRDTGLLSQGSYDVLEERRAERKEKPKTPGGQYYMTAISRVGRRYASNVVGAWEAGAIDRQEAGVLLELPEHNVDRFRRELAGAGGG